MADPSPVPPSPVRRWPILYIARGGAVDGASRQLLYLITHLDRTRFDPIAVLDEPGPIADALRVAGAHVEIAPMRPWRSLRGLPFRGFDSMALTRLGRAHQAAIVHCSDPTRAPYARSVARRLGVPWVLHVRGPTTPRDLQKYHCLHADRIIGIAERYRAEIESAAYPAQQVTIIDDAVDPAEYRVDPAERDRVRKELGLSGLTVGLVGRVEPLKRVSEFIDAAVRVPRELDATFLVIGALHREEYAELIRAKIADQGLPDRIRLVGRRNDMPAILCAIDLLVTLSGGSVMFEAMACGTCVLSVRPDGRHSQHTVHQETAWCVTTDDPQPAADAMDRLLRDHELRSRLAEAGRVCVTNRLCPRLMTRKTEAVYDALLANHHTVSSR
jgi:glycosyltransferase involved in cell wall biosynthesis